MRGIGAVTQQWPARQRRRDHVGHARPVAPPRVACTEGVNPGDLPPPCIYPTESGGLQTEWSLTRDEISIEVDLTSRRAFWHALAKAGDGESAFEVDLGTDLGWAELARLIRSHCGQAG